MGGPVGLDYNVLFYRLDRMNLSESEHDQLFADVQVVEAVALGILNRKED